MPEYEITGARKVDGDEREFWAPQIGEDEADARERFLDAVEDPTEFTIE